jgi:hypothetical protein
VYVTKVSYGDVGCVEMVLSKHFYHRHLIFGWCCNISMKVSIMRFQKCIVAEIYCVMILPCEFVHLSVI